MSAGTKQVVLELPEEVYSGTEAAAQRNGRRIEEYIGSLLEQEINRASEFRKRWEKLSEDYTNRLEREGKLNQSAEEIMAEIRRVREEVARELYP